MKKILLPLAMLLSYTGMGQQWDIGGGPSIGAPLMYNQYVGSNHHAAPSLNAEFIARYLPANLSFYPQLNVSVGGSEVPVLKADQLVINMFFLQIEAILSARIVYKIDEKRELHYGMGLGGIYYQSQGVSVSLKGNQNAYSGETRQEINGWLPTVNIGGEFITRISVKKPVYCGVGGRLGYTYFANSTETIDAGISSGSVPGTQINVGPKGNMITPVLHLSFYYRFGERYH